jgi:hypothetical protein
VNKLSFAYIRAHNFTSNLDCAGKMSFKMAGLRGNQAGRILCEQYILDVTTCYLTSVLYFSTLHVSQLKSAQDSDLFGR